MTSNTLASETRIWVVPTVVDVAVQYIPAGYCAGSYLEVCVCTGPSGIAAASFQSFYLHGVRCSWFGILRCVGAPFVSKTRSRAVIGLQICQ